MENKLSPEAKRKNRYQSWLNGEGIPFKNEDTKKDYQARINRLIDAIELKKTPDRVPIFPLGTFMQAELYNVTPGECMYDYPKMLNAQKRFIEDFEPDYYGSPAFIGSGKVFEILGLNQYKWPRHGVSEHSGYQCVEAEYMQAGDYQSLIDDPSDFWIRKFLPRIFNSLAPLANISPFPHLWEIVGISGQMIPFGIPDVQNALKALIEAGNEAMGWIQQVMGFEMEVRGMGYPTGIGGAAKAPFDILADTLRGTRGIMTDLFRQPEMVLRAMERLIPIYIQQGVGMATQFDNPIVFMPLHKGADGFMSDEQFKTFYWPQLKAVILGLVEEGCVPFLFCEGGFNTRLKYLQELPKGSCFWLFDRTDLIKAKEMLNQRICIGGNVPAGMILTSTPAEVKAYCKRLIDACAKGGGYIMAFGTAMDEGNADNIHAMIDFTKDYGVYR